MSNESYQEIQKIISVDAGGLLNDPGVLRDKLARIINDLIENDFPNLVNILYRIDVSEAKLKDMLNKHADEDAGRVIANLIIERQIQKSEARKGFGDNTTVGDDEKW